MFHLSKSHNIDEIKTLSNNSTIEENRTFRETIVKHYQDKNFTVWDYTKERGSKDQEINIIVKKRREITLIHAQLSTTDISRDDIKQFEKQKDKFIIENPIFAEYTIKLRYALAGFFLTEDAFRYIQEHSKFISYEIIK